MPFLANVVTLLRMEQYLVKSQHLDFFACMLNFLGLHVLYPIERGLQATRAQGARSMETSGMIWPPSAQFDEVLEKARHLDHEALSMLYWRFLPAVYRYILIRIGDPHHTEDLAADTFFAMVEGITTLRASDELSFAAWLFRIARNKVAMHFRHMRTHAEVWQEAVDAKGDMRAVGDEDDPLAIITAREDWATVLGAIERLTEEQRVVVLYRYVLGYPIEEVATLLGKSPKAVRSLQSRALASLARHLGIKKRVRSQDPEAYENMLHLGENSHVL